MLDRVAKIWTFEYEKTRTTYEDEKDAGLRVTNPQKIQTFAQVGGKAVFRRRGAAANLPPPQPADASVADLSRDIGSHVALRA